ncbi:MAG TPA: heavy-metal-associated domain-containing protein [Ignavibacteria bacterium]|nr:heavy-metal-associated domain-containing protein [Ignavibacteria bacterium]HQY52081.1 heavy-metal-associated domain-containing protein [Ignavibacteria bacterium]HRA99995.1 heavy-metal-associated domain-containing protein [Ignavibacteria bacterium]
MKKINLTILALVFSAFIYAGCGDSDNKTESENSDTKKSEETTSTSKDENKTAGEEPHKVKGELLAVDVPTIQCGTCTKNIKNALNKVDGVIAVNVSVDKKKCMVDYDASKTDLTVIEGAIVSAGYQANDKPADKTAYDNLNECCKIGGH